MDKSEDIVFSSTEKETLLIVNILLYDIITEHALLQCIDLAPTLQKRADNTRSFFRILYCSHWQGADD